jgi:hypothetical protein
MDLLDKMADREFLGVEFYMWLLYLSEINDGLFKMADYDLELLFDDQLVLEVKLSQAEQSRLKGGSPAYSPEARKALQLGKLITTARFSMARDERRWKFSGNSSRFALSGIRTPQVLSREEDDAFDERMYLIEELDQMWHDLYRVFLKERISPAWESRADAMREWIAEPTSDEPRQR